MLALRRAIDEELTLWRRANANDLHVFECVRPSIYKWYVKNSQNASQFSLLYKGFYKTILTTIVDLRLGCLRQCHCRARSKTIPPPSPLPLTPPPTPHPPPPLSVKNVPEISRRKKVCLEIFKQLQDSYSACPSLQYFLISPFIWFLFSQVDKQFAS